MDTTLSTNQETAAAPVIPYADGVTPVHPYADVLPAAPQTPCLLDWCAPLILLGLAILATLPGWLPKRVYLPTDALSHTNDATWVTTFAGQQIRRGDVPLWNPNAGLGEPLLARGNLGALAPTILPHLLKSPTWSWTISAMLKLCLAGLGVWLLAGKYGLHGLPRLFAGVAFMLCGFNVFNLADPLTSVVCWLPWGVLVVERLVDRVTLLRIIVAALVFAAQFLVGNPAASLAILLTCGAVLLLNLVFVRPLASVAAIPAALLAALIGLGIAGVQWLPLLDYASLSGPPAGVALRWTSAWVGVIPLLLALFAIATGWRGHRLVMLTILAVNAACIPVAANLLPHSLRATALCTPLLATAAMSVALLSGFGLANIRSFIPWKADESARDVRAPWIFAGVAMIELLAVAIWVHRGVPARDYAAAQAHAAQVHASREDVNPIGHMTLTGRGAVPRAWFVANSDWVANKQELESRAAEASFAPLSMVLFTKEGLSEDALEWSGRTISTDRPRGGPRPQSRSRGFFGIGGAGGGGASNSKVEVTEESANRLRVQASPGSTGWVVISAAYADGWSAKAAPMGRFGRGAMSTEHLVLPAYGALLAVEVDAGAPADMVIEYKPAAFRRGLLVTTGAALVLVLLLGCALIGKVRPDTI